MIVSLADLKAHLRVDPSNTEEDAVIAAIGRAAELQVQAWIGRPIYASAGYLPAMGAAGYNPDQIVADEAIRVAIKMLAERMYQVRGGEDGTAEDAVPPLTVRALLSSYRLFHPTPAPGESAP
ncbi:hypothetical protein F8A10_07720 [Paracoccus kondratievae]|uniref:head-tail connector protein n=1 Tax=Paracoccus kondratievae TaxID=135740 RepID=UPI0012666F8A|nr:head-tail connector protein [Paracoccus kondratievae]QFQ87321.1 hypothetical protein F8A10_07720 [Paracoccus kondratievae]